MHIPSTIDKIVEQRQSKLPLVEELKQRLEKVKVSVSKLEKVCQEANSGESKTFGSLFEQHPEIAEQLRFVNTKAFNECYMQTQSILEQLHVRFSRKEIHISFVGRAGQGKSLVMQNISGLSGKVIPSSDGADCTGAKSIITNRSGQGVSAEITFYSRSEYRDIVNKYLREIFGEGIYEIESVETIASLKDKGLQSKVDISSAQKQSLYLQLEKYIEHSAEVLPLLGTTKLVPEDEIESYVAQYSNEDKNKKYFVYLGVKVANILCSFPCSQCGKIVLVDTIGLGATALDIREQMLETVSNDSDAILLMTRPDAQRPRVEQDDISIVTDIGDKMTAEYTRRMLFWVLNKVNSGVGRNVDGIPGVLNQLKKMPDFPTAAFLEVDCKDKETVEKELLIPVLEQLSSNLPEMDEMLLANAQQQLEILYREYHAIAEKAGQAFSASIDQDTRREFRIEIQKSYKKMTNSIRELYVSEPYGILRNQPCEKLKTAVEQKLRNILTRIPEEAEVMELLDDGSINQHNAYENLTDKMRLSIINDFLELNTVLHDLVVEMKQRITHCLADEDQGRLGFLIAINPDDADTWLNELLLHTESNADYNLINEALRKLLAFDLRMESFLIYRVRAHLDVIDISLIPQGPALRGTLAEKDILAKDIIFWLEHNLEIVYKEIKAELEPLYTYPNSALWAVVKDFYDRIVYASDTQRDVATAWRYLYEDGISSIWKTEYSFYQAQKGVSESWNTLVNEIRKYDNKGIFSFIYKEV